LRSRLARLPARGLRAAPPRREARLARRAGRQAQRGQNSLGIGVPVGRMSAKQMHALADPRGELRPAAKLRLTVWQKPPHPARARRVFSRPCGANVQRLGFFTEASLATGGVVACTGSRGCKYAAADTKAHAPRP